MKKEEQPIINLVTPRDGFRKDVASDSSPIRLRAGQTDYRLTLKSTEMDKTLTTTGVTKSTIATADAIISSRGSIKKPKALDFTGYSSRKNFLFGCTTPQESRFESPHNLCPV